MELRNKKDLIEQFIESLNISSSVDDDWISFVEKKKIEELEKIIENENLNHKATYNFIENAFRDWYVQKTWTWISKVLPPVSRFSKDKARSQKRKTVIEKLTSFFERFFDISKKEM